jgi:2-phosphosulfolactate phosphatase
LLLTIFFNPVELRSVEAPENDVYIVLDVMRATTTMAVMFDQGARRVLAAQTLEQAREASQKMPDRLLCGERHAKTPPGFDYNNSPAQFAQIDLSGRDLILTTSNGTRALFACPERSIRLAGSFYNAQAVVSAAFACAQERDCNISIVCASEYGYFSLEDTTCAGYLALELLRQHPSCQVRDSVHAAIALHESYPSSRLLEHAQSANDLRASGQEQDLEFCVRKNASDCVPAIVGVEAETGLLILKANLYPG